MNTSGLRLFDLAEARLTWTDKRQMALSRNVANASTPGYRSADIEPFEARMPGGKAASLHVTQPMHLLGLTPDTLAASNHASVHSVDGNEVTIDHELMRVAETESMHAMTAAIYKRYITMFNTALSRS